MNKTNFYISFITLVLLALGCAIPNNPSSAPSTPINRGLTTDRAQSTLNGWVQKGQVTVRGIQDLSKENAAKADLTFTNFEFIGDGLQRNYSGPGTAIFKHYNDGRWVLTHVSTNEGFGSINWNDLNVPVN